MSFTDSLVPASAGPPAASIETRYRQVRGASERICEPLETEDFVIQTMGDVSPPKWHLAHTSWFFETFILARFASGYKAFDPHFAALFNSYYEALGERHPRAERGLLSRPTVQQVYSYRRHVDQAMIELLAAPHSPEVAELATLGLNHEQQHQELLLTDLKHILAANPLRPAYQESASETAGETAPLDWVDYPGGVRGIGREGSGFHFDNEGPRHDTLLRPFALGSRLVTNGEYLELIEDGGYRDHRHWLSAGWATVQERGWQAPLYWEKAGGGWSVYTLAGMRPVDPAEPVCHISYFEADAYAAWAKARLPTEAEWEVAAREEPRTGNLFDGGPCRPAAAPRGPLPPLQLYGDVWEWTASPYTPYPGFRAAEGAVGEYNGKFMCNQYVLRGGSCATAADHIRPTYRNFFAPDARWQFSGVRLAR